MNIKIPAKRIGDKFEFDQEYSLYNGKLIGQGSFGCVYRCRSKEDNIEWAIKIIEVPDREESKDLTERELSIYLQMDSHPNIIKVKRLYQWNNDVTHKVSAAIVQELADKGLYDEFIQRKKTGMSYTEEEIISFLSQSVSGLNFLMKKNGIFHRDIKTENILLKNGQIKITDFGVSKSIQQEKIRSLQANTIAGTPLFFSPKVWDAYIKRNDPSVVHDLQKSDIFSLGLVFLQVALLLGNNEIAGINQADGNKQLFSILRRIRSNRLRTCLFGMLAYEESQRLDYDQISKILSMKDSDFENIRQNQMLVVDPRSPVINQQQLSPRHNFPNQLKN